MQVDTQTQHRGSISFFMALFRTVAACLFTVTITGFSVAQTTSLPVSPSAPAPIQEEYRIGPGDELSVTFPYNAELNHDGSVGPDGRFTLPLLGNIELAGNTLNQASTIISDALRNAGIVQNAYPNLSVRHYGTSVYVGGQVKSPGLVQIVSGMDALQAIIAAGGFTDSAKTGKIAIIRRTADNHPSMLYIDVKAYTHGKANSTMAVVQPRDIIFVPRSKISEVDLWIDNYINKTLPFSRGLNYSYGNYPVTTVTK